MFSEADFLSAYRRFLLPLYPPNLNQGVHNSRCATPANRQKFNLRHFPAVPPFAAVVQW